MIYVVAIVALFMVIAYGTRHLRYLDDDLDIHDVKDSEVEQ